MKAMKVNLFSIGAMRAASTSIYHYLGQHPEIYMSPVKEPDYFIAEYCRRRLASGKALSKRQHESIERILNSGKYRTAEAYQSLFEGAEDYKYIGEASCYLHHPPTAELIHEYNPHSKIIICLRNPIDRIHSEYMLYVRDSKVDVSFSEFISSRIIWNKDKNVWEPQSANRLNKGFYSKQIAPWLYCFGKENVKIFLFEDIARDPAHICQLLYIWLEVDSAFKPEKVHAQRSGKPISKKLMRVINNNYLIRRYAKPVLPSLLRIKIRDYFYKTFLKKEKMSVHIQDILKIIYFEEINQLEKMVSIDLSKWK